MNKGHNKLWGGVETENFFNEQMIQMFKIMTQ